MKMKTKLAKKYIKRLLIKAAVGVALTMLSACQPTAERLHNKANSEIEKGHFRLAVDLLERSSEAEKSEIIKYATLLEAARITRFEIQDFERAIRLFRKIILQSPDEQQRIESQRAIAEIYLENLQNYSAAQRELQILEPLIKNLKDKEKIKLKTAQALYLTGNYQSAIEEIDISIKESRHEKQNFMKLKAQVLVAKKNYKDAITVYQNIFKYYPEFFEKENLFMATSVVYEENEKYAEALDYLLKNEKQIKDKAYFELRVKRLKERLVNKPFYKGKRK